MNTPQANLDPAYLAAQELSPTILDRFMAKIRVNDNGCWIWTGFIWHGYGQISRGITRCRAAQVIGAHKVSYILFKGPIAPGENVLHKCPGVHNKACCNPAHLKLGGKDENGRDSIVQGTNCLCRRHDQFGVKLNQRIADKIRREWKGVRGEQTSVANKYGVSRHAISLIVRNITWWDPDAIAVPLVTRPQAKITWEQVRAIRAQYTGKRGNKTELATRFGLHSGTIAHIVNHTIWKEEADYNWSASSMNDNQI